MVAGVSAHVECDCHGCVATRLINFALDFTNQLKLRTLLNDPVLRARALDEVPDTFERGLA
jgi:hypothetical protein